MDQVPKISKSSPKKCLNSEHWGFQSYCSNHSATTAKYGAHLKKSNYYLIRHKTRKQTTGTQIVFRLIFFVTPYLYYSAHILMSVRIVFCSVHLYLEVSKECHQLILELLQSSPGRLTHPPNPACFLSGISIYLVLCTFK